MSDVYVVADGRMADSDLALYPHALQPKSHGNTDPFPRPFAGILFLQFEIYTFIGTSYPAVETRVRITTTIHATETGRVFLSVDMVGPVVVPVNQ